MTHGHTSLRNLMLNSGQNLSLATWEPPGSKGAPRKELLRGRNSIDDVYEIARAKLHRQDPALVSQSHNCFGTIIPRFCGVRPVANPAVTAIEVFDFP